MYDEEITRTFSAATFSLKTLNTMGLIVTLGMTRHCIECHYGDCRVLFIGMLNALILIATMLKYRYYECPSTERHLAGTILNEIMNCIHNTLFSS